MNLRNVLVLVDFSDYSKAALKAGFQWSRATGSTLHVYHHVETVLPGMTPEEFKKLWQKEAEQQAASDVRSMLEDLIGPQAEGVQIHVTSGKFLPKLIEVTDKNNFDILFIGSKGRGAFSEILSGSVVSKVISYLSIPVAAISRDYRITKGFDFFVSVNTRHDFHQSKLVNLLRPLGHALHSLEFITIVDPGNYSDVATAGHKLEAISHAFNEFAESRHKVLQGGNVYDELMRLMNEKPNSFIVVQKGDSDDVKNILGRSLVYELIRHQETPVVILP